MPYSRNDDDTCKINDLVDIDMTTVASVKLIAVNLCDTNHTATNLYVRQH